MSTYSTPYTAKRALARELKRLVERDWLVKSDGYVIYDHQAKRFICSMAPLYDTQYSIFGHLYAHPNGQLNWYSWTKMVGRA